MFNFKNQQQMTKKHPLDIKTTNTSVHFFFDGVFLHSIKNKLINSRGFRYNGYNGVGYFDAYLRNNKIYVTEKFLGDDGQLKKLKTSYNVPRRRLNEVRRALADNTASPVAE